jgi:deoxyhypusine synthase
MSADAKAAVFVKSEEYNGTRIHGPDFNAEYDLQQLLESYNRIGFQANGLARAMELINKMVRTLLCTAPVPSLTSKCLS